MNYQDLFVIALAAIAAPGIFSLIVIAGTQVLLYFGED